jgi:hypothetical protein
VYLSLSPGYGTWWRGASTRVSQSECRGDQACFLRFSSSLQRNSSLEQREIIMLPSQSERLPRQCPLKVHEVPNTVSTGSKNIDEAHAPQEQCERPLTSQLKRTGDTLPPSNVKAILHDSFCVCLKARIIPSALSASDAIDGRQEGCDRAIPREKDCTLVQIQWLVRGSF